MLLVILTLMWIDDGPSVCLWPITGVPQLGQNCVALALRSQGQRDAEHLMGQGLLSKPIVLQCTLTFLDYKQIIGRRLGP